MGREEWRLECSYCEMRGANPCLGATQLGNSRVASMVVIDANGANLKTARNAEMFFVIATLLFVAQVSAQEASAKRGAVKGIVSLESGTREHATAEGIALELKPLTNGSAPMTTVTDAGGNFEFTGLADGEYVLRLPGDGFEPFTATVRIADGATVAQNVLAKLAGLTQRVEVKEQAEPLSTSASSASKFSDKQLSGLPLAEENFRESLPLTPGVIRTPDGKLTFRGASEDQSMLQVNDFKMTDPVTGSFSIPVPLDAVQSVRVVKTPYSAEKGGFSGGLTEVETVPPPESWRFAVRDLNVSLRGKNGHFVGVGRATPRVVFGGPLLKGKLSLSEVYEYDVTRDPVRGLAWPRNEIKKQGFTSYTTLQAILSPRHVMTVTLNIFPQRTQFANISALIPQTASSDYDRKGASVSLSDVYSFPSGALFRMGWTYTRFDSDGHGQGSEPMLLTPEGWDGNFFNTWARSAGQFEASPTFQFAQRHLLGRHEIRVGDDITYRSFRGISMSRPIHIVREDGRIAEEIRFTNQMPTDESITDIEEFVEDHWSLGGHLAVDLGARLTSQSIGRAAAFAPRFGVAYSPGKDQKTVVRAGIGVFYNRVPLLAADFAGNPVRIVSEFGIDGQIVGPEVTFRNAYVENGSGPIASRIRHAPNTSARSVVESAELERALWKGAMLRIGYAHSSMRDIFVVNSVPGSGSFPSVLGLLSSGRNDYNEANATLRFHPVAGSELNVSYTWSRSRGDLNTLGDIFVPFEQPIIRPNMSGVRPSDVPNRVVVWGLFRLPWAIALGPIADLHTGFPYSGVDERQQYVGVANSHRFPTFFSVDFQVYRDFRLPFVNYKGSHMIRLGLYVINVTNHGNFSDVFNNTTSPQFGEFAGLERRKTAFLLSIVN